MCNYISTGENVLIGDYGRIFWLDEEGNEVARSGGGGFGDYTDGVVRSIHMIEVVYPPWHMNGIHTNHFDSGNDTIYGNAEKDIIFGCGGELGKIFLVLHFQRFRGSF